jgi:hypothetical protein
MKDKEKVAHSYILIEIKKIMIGRTKTKEKGPIRESNPGPPAPKAGIMPLDQSDSYLLLLYVSTQY